MTATDLAPRTPAERRLVDRRTGLVTRLVRHPAEPRFPLAWVGVSAHVADTSRHAPWQADRHGFGAALGDEDRARAAALGEAVERYCGNAAPRRPETASFEDLTAAGRRAVDPRDLALYSPRQHARPGFPFAPFTPDLPVAWVEGTDLHDGGRVAVPAALVHLNHRRPTGAAATNPIAYSGIAAGPGSAAAEAAALEEVLERDATTIWWATGAPAARITGADHLVARLDDPAAEDRTVTLLRIPSPLGVPVVGAFVEDHRDRVVAFGSACRASAALAAEKALVEAFGLLSITRKLADPDSEVWRAVRAGAIPAHTYVPHRPDRAYRRSFRPDYRDLVDLPGIAQLYLDPVMQARPLDRLRRPPAAVALAEVPAVGGDRRAAYLERLRTAGLAAVAVELTTPDVAAAGLAVARVVVPGLYGNAPPAYPYRGGRRLYEVPVAAGWVPGPVEEERLACHPLPLA